MPTFDTSTPRKEAKYAGVTLQAPHPFTEGHALTVNEAAFLNRVAAGAVGNAMAGDVRRGIEALDKTRAEAFKAGTYEGPMAQKADKNGNPVGKPFPAPATAADLSFMADAQSYYDAKYAGYTLGESNRGDGEGTLSPVERAMRAMATDKVKELLKAKNKNIRTVMQAKAEDGSGVFSGLVDQYLARHGESLRPIAEAQVASMAQLDADADLLEGLADDEPEAEAQPEG